MKHITFCTLCLLIIAGFAGLAAQPQASALRTVAWSSPPPTAPDTPVLEPHLALCAPPETGEQDDSAYAAYKLAYKLVVQEKWGEAQKKLQEVMKKYPKSKYVDDAMYWYAYSLKSSDKRKAIDAYKEFLEQYRSSNYFEDAIADLARLENRDAERLAETYARAHETYNRTRELYAVPREAAVPYVVMEPFEPGRSRELARTMRDDPELRMRIEALQALMRSKDEKTFALLKQTALDTSQAIELRQAAISGLRQYPEKNVFDLYTQLLRIESDKRIQVVAIYQLEVVQKDSADRKRAFTLLKQLATDRERETETRRAALDALRHLDDPNVLATLTEIARNDPDRKIQEFAVYTIAKAKKGSEDKRFSILKDILLDRERNREVRYAALRSIQEIKGAEAQDLFLKLAKDDPDSHVQEMALWFYVEAMKDEPEKRFQTLRDLMFDRSRSAEFRVALLNNITSLETNEAFDLLVQVAKSDVDERIRTSAIFRLGHLGKKREKALETLVEIFEATPKGEKETLRNTLYAIASIGNDKAIDFLSKVAKKHEDYEMRRVAVSLLGNIGGEKARTALYDILKGKQ